MNNPIFEADSFAPLFPVSDNMAMDLNGHFKVRLSDTVAMDMDSGEMRFTTPWVQPHGGDDD